MSNLKEDHIQNMASALRSMSSQRKKADAKGENFYQGDYLGYLNGIFYAGDLERKDYVNLMRLDTKVLDLTTFEKYLEIEECANLIRETLLEN